MSKKIYLKPTACPFKLRIQACLQTGSNPYWDDRHPSPGDWWGNPGQGGPNGPGQGGPNGPEHGGPGDQNNYWHGGWGQSKESSLWDE